jgi:creatinine amidohydrolase/Fe(II)-dependent formamide hydrolase-like protein
VAFLPVGCVEQHGPFLPLQTDSILATAFAQNVAASMQQKGDNSPYCAPPVHFTPTESNVFYPGTVSVNADVFAQYAEAVCRSLLDQFSAVVVLNAHGPAEFRLKEIAARLVHEQFLLARPSPKPIFVVSCYEFDKQLGELLQLIPGKHADWREFLCLYYLYGRQLFPDSVLKKMYEFQKGNEFTIESSAVLGIPMQYRSVQGVLGNPFPFNVSRVPRLARLTWSYIQQSVEKKIERELNAFSKKEWRET